MPQLVTKYDIWYD